jgi:hypothetical protein
MGALTAILQGIGRTGSNIAEGRLAEEDRKLKMLQSRMALEQITQRLGMEKQAAALNTPEGIRSQLKGVLGREPTPEELQRRMGVAPKEFAPKKAYTDIRFGEHGAEGLSTETGQYEHIPGGEDLRPSSKSSPKADFQRLYAKALADADPKQAAKAMTDPSQLSAIIQGSKHLTEDEKRNAMAYLGTNTTPASQAAGRALGYQILTGPRWAALDPKVQARIALARSVASGNYAAQLTSFNAFLGHAKDLKEYFSQLGNLDIRLLNIPLNRAREYTNSPEIIGVLAKMEPVRKEFESFLLNNRALYETDREDAQKILNENLTLAMTMEALNSFTKTASIRLGALNASVKRVTGADIPDIVEPENGDFLWEMGYGIPGYTGNSTFEQAFPAPSGTPGKAPTGATKVPVKGRGNVIVVSPEDMK